MACMCRAPELKLVIWVARVIPTLLSGWEGGLQKQVAALWHVAKRQGAGS